MPEARSPNESRIIVAGRQPESLRTRNTSAILRAVLARGPIARSRIARLTGLSQTSVTRLTTELVAQRLLAEVPAGSTGTTREVQAEIGRPLIPIDFDVEAWVALGMHIGRERTTFAIADLRGRLIASEDVPHPARDPAAIVTHAAQIMPQLARRRTPSARALGIGVSVGGWVEPDAGIVVENDALGWRDVPLRAQFEAAFDLPVLVESNVRAMALTELWFGAATKAQSLVYVFIGNVVGAAIVVGRTIHRGPFSAAGGIAHMRLTDGDLLCACGRTGCFQTETTDLSLARRAMERGLIAQPLIAELVTAARAGNGAAHGLFEARARAIGEGLAVIIGLINPDLIVLAGSGVTAAPEYFGAIRAEAQRRCVLPIDPQHTILPSALGTSVLGSSSVALVLDAFYRQEIPFAVDRSAAG